MNKTLLTMSFVLAQALTVSAFAQSKGEADPETSKAAPSARATAAEKAAAKKARKAEGIAVEKSGVRPDKDPQPMGKAKAATKEERLAAAQKRKTVAAEAVKKGETTKGEQ